MKTVNESNTKEKKVAYSWQEIFPVYKIALEIEVDADLPG